MYPILDIKIPQEKKREINQKILSIVDSEQNHPQITPSVIFNTYSPLGAIHGLEFNNYDNFHQFQEAKKDVTFGQYFTPLQVAKFLCLMLKIPREWKVADLTAGHGSLINFLQNPQENIYCNEWELKAYKLLKYLYPNINHVNKDIREYNTGELMDCIIGNPPFSLTWQYNKNTYNSEVFYLLKSAEMLKPAGLCAIIVPESFIVDDFTDKGNINLINKHFNFIGQFVLPSNIFESVGAKITTKIMIFQKKSEHIQEYPYTNGQHNRIELENLDHKTAACYYNEYIRPLYEQKEKVKSKIVLEAIKQGNEKNSDFEYKVRKMLFDIKQGKNTNKHYNRAEAYLLKFKTQEKPQDMEYVEWQKARITENKVLAYLKKILKEQHKKEGENKIELVKDKYALRLKPYNRTASGSLKKLDTIKEMSFNDMLIKGVYPFSDEKYLKLFNKKRAGYEKQNAPFSEIPYNSELARWLDEFSLYNKETNQTIKLKDFQKEDLNKILQKDKSLLAWSVGLGKTEAGITWVRYITEHRNVRNTFVISSAISIKMTWTDRLKNYNIPFVKVESLKDIEKIKLGDTVLMSFNMLVKYQRQIKKYIKLQSRKIALILDESHRCIYPNTKTTRSVIDVFRKVPYKLLASGTPSKNNANELYSQFAILYGSSVNFLCECEKVLVEDRKTGELREENNKYYMKPFPMNKQSVFSSCFSPKRASVFGIEKSNQDLLNTSELKKLIGKTIIVRRMFDVLTDDIVTFETHRISQNTSEKEVYSKIMKEFYQMIPSYFKSSGNSKKDAMMRIIRQIMLMNKCTSNARLFKEYEGTEDISKLIKIKSIVKNAHSEKVAIGCTFIDTARYYYNRLSTLFPNRKLVLILGDVPFKKRQEIIKEYEETKNGILISTQQSLSESVSIPSCGIVICSDLQWNIANVQQYIGRFTRLNSENKTTVHFVTYENTLEQNVLALLMVKERINEFIKTLEFKDQSDVFSEFGITFDIFNSIITKEKDEDGHVQLVSWGSQKVV